MSNTYYITTPLYYVNAAPHLGHSYTTVAADCLARFQRSKGAEVFLLTGTDEHGQKIAQAAQAAGQMPQLLVDQMMGRYAALWKLLNISHDDFIRTTQPRHMTAVQAILARLHETGQLTRASYRGWYCTPDETFWTEAELADAAGGTPTCPACRRALEPVTEEGWHLPLRGAQGWLRQFAKSHRAFVRPESRYNEVCSLLESPLPESLCITRPKSRVPWGIPVSFDPDCVTYVWFDALLNYITVPGYVDDPARFAQLWPADVHFIGKDILRHHAVYWPIMLHALGLSDEQMPRMIFAHGWWKIGEQKMSKSLGNIVDPSVMIGAVLKGQPYAADVYRYFLLRDVPFGQDGNFSEDAVLARLQADLGNDLGNLVHRTLSMLARYSDGAFPDAGGGPGWALADEPLRQHAVGLADVVEEAMRALDFSTALATIMRVVSEANRYIESQAPWQLAKAGHRARLNGVLYTLAEVIRICAVVLEPFMPSVADAMWRQLGLGTVPRRFEDARRWAVLAAGRPIGTPQVLFPKREVSTAA